MITPASIAALREGLDVARAGGRTVGLVPTMGYLHDGHAGLVRRAALDCDEVVVTVFVNPLQFAEGEDLDTYPRDPDGDAATAAGGGATVMFVPDPVEMYPRGGDGVLTRVSVEALSSTMEGSSRRTHFAGVCTVVAKLFNIVGPCRAYFGEKDFQQLAIIRQLVEDLSFPVEVVGCPTAREPDGLAMSSRNAYLSAQEREVAPVLQRALQLGAAAIRSGTTDADEVRTLVRSEIQAAPLGELDYVEVADRRTLRPQQVAGRGSRLFGALRFGRARLIDNVGVATSDEPGAEPDVLRLLR